MWIILKQLYLKLTEKSKYSVDRWILIRFLLFVYTCVDMFVHARGLVGILVTCTPTYVKSLLL